jgi:hypothetical protein
MLIIRTTPSEDPIEWPVSVNTPVPGGKTKKYEFSGIFRRLTDAENEAIAKNAVEAASSDADFKVKFLDNIMQVMVGWKNVVDSTNQDIEFNRDNLNLAIRTENGLAIMAGINRALLELSMGVRQKN